MKRNIYLISALTAATIALTTACQSDNLPLSTSPDTHPDAVRFTATVGNATTDTRSNPVGDAEAQKRFNPGDKIGLTSPGQPEAVYSLATGDAATWMPAESAKFLRWNSETQPQTFHAYYPVGTNPTYGTDGKPNGTLTTDGNNFALPTSQADDAEIAAADYMTTPPAGIARSKANGPVALALSRRTARIVVKIAAFNSEYTAQEQLYVASLQIYTRTTAIKDGAVQINLNNLTAILPYISNESYVGKGYGIGTTFTALVLPDVAHPDDNFIFLQDHTDKSLFVRGIPAVEAGMSYEYALTVGKERLTLTEVSVKPWDGEVTMPGGETELPGLDLDILAVGQLTPQVITAAIENGTLTLNGKLRATIKGNSDYDKTYNGGHLTALRSYLLDEATKGNITTLDLRGVTDMTELRTWKWNADNSSTGLFQGAEFTAVHLPTSVTLLGTTFYDCRSLTTVTGLDNVTQDLGNSFQGCPSLASISMPRVQMLSCTFASSGLTDFSGPEVVALLGIVFSGCTSLRTVTLPQATSISIDLFSGCTSLQEIHLTAAAFDLVNSSNDLANGLIGHPFSDIQNQGNCTLYLNASQQANIDTDAQTWSPKQADGTPPKYLFDPVPLDGFKAVYCGETKVLTGNSIDN